MVRFLLLAALVAGLVWLLVTMVAHREASYPPVVEQPIETAAPVQPTPAPAPVEAPKHRVHAKFLFHGEHCPSPWLKLPGSVTCMETGMQYLVDENAWSVPVK